MALRSLMETVACLHLIRRRSYAGKDLTKPIYEQAEELSAKIQAMRNAIQPDKKWVREKQEGYSIENRKL
jgi:four helix bundle protein